MRKSEEGNIKTNREFNDYELIYLFTQGDEEALLLLMQKYKRVSYLYIDRYYYSMPKLLDRHDMYQMSLISLYNAILTYNEEKNSSFSTYFSVILNHDLLMYIRKLKKEANRSNLNTISLDQEIRDSDGIYLIESIANDREEFEPNQYVSNRAMHSVIDEQLKQFDNKEQEVFRLWMNGYTYLEICEQVDLNRKKVEYIIRKIKGTLKLSLYDWK